jgi:hypothetical protein
MIERESRSSLDRPSREGNPTKYVLVDGPSFVADESDEPLPGHYRAEFRSSEGELLQRYLTEGGRAHLLDAIDEGRAEFTHDELVESTVEADMEALLARYDEEAAVGG